MFTTVLRLRIWFLGCSPSPTGGTASAFGWPVMTTTRSRWSFLNPLNFGGMRLCQWVRRMHLIHAGLLIMNTRIYLCYKYLDISLSNYGFCLHAVYEQFVMVLYLRSLGINMRSAAWLINAWLRQLMLVSKAYVRRGFLGLWHNVFIF